MSREKLLELAARCEAATGPDRELDALIAAAIGIVPGFDLGTLIPPISFGGCKDGGVEVFGCDGSRVAKRPSPSYTASLDAAMTLIPEGWDGALYLAADAHKPCVQLETPEMRSSFRMLEEMAEGTADSLALALTAACLRARASLTGEKA